MKNGLRKRGAIENTAPKVSFPPLSKAQEALVTGNRALVPYVVRQHIPGRMPDDAVSEGMVGLVMAAHRFDPGRGVKFNTYAGFWIRAYVLRWVLKDKAGGMMLGSTAAERRAFWNISRVRRRVGEDPVRVASELRVPVETAERMMQRLSARDVPLDHGDDETSRFVRNDRFGSPDDVLAVLADEAETAGRRQRLRQALELLPDRERHVLRSRWLTGSTEPRTLQEIATEMGVSRERVRQIETKAILLLKKRFAHSTDLMAAAAR